MQAIEVDSKINHSQVIGRVFALSVDSKALIPRGELVERARKVVHEVIAPRAAHCDQSGEFPAEGIAALQSAGLMGLLVPAQYGGLEADHGTYSQIAQLIAGACPSTGMLFVMHHTYVVPIVDHGSERQKQFFLPPIARGERLVTSATTEPQGGGGAHSMFALQRAGEELIIDAIKPCVSGANHADWIAVLIRPSADCPGDVKTLVLAPGVRSGAVKPFGEWNTIGMRATSSSGLRFEGCRVPAWYELGSGTYTGFSSGMPTLILGYSSVWLGLANAAYEVAVAHVTRREHQQIVADRRHRGDAAPGPEAGAPTTTVKSTVASIESVQRQVSELRAGLDAAHALVDALARAIDRHRPPTGAPFSEAAQAELRSLCASTRLVTGDTAIDTCRTAMRICGLRALQRGFPLERLMRDALTSQPMAPSEDACKVDHGRRLLGV